MFQLREIKEKILQRTSLAELIGEFVPLRNQSGRPMGCCPFHAEKTPSFYVYDDHYHCFGCGAHGDVFSFIQNRQGLSFTESVKWLCNKYGIESLDLDAQTKQSESWKKSIAFNKLMAQASLFFQHCLASKEGDSARDYLKGRGISAEIIQSFGLGYAPNSSDSLLRHLHSLGFKNKEIEEASLLSSYDEKKALDFFRHRVMIPIRDTFGRLIAFGGRALSEHAKQKYKNSRYDKGSTLFAMDLARTLMGQRGRAIVVEGYLDAISLHSNGFFETVACQGTALTSNHLRALSSATKRIYLLFDGDQAGKQAASKVLEESLKYPKLEFKVASLENDHDPDSFIRSHGRDALEEILSKSQDLLTFVIDNKLENSASTAIPALIKTEFLPLLSKIEDPIAQSYLRKKIATRAGIELSALEKVLKDEQKNDNHIKKLDVLDHNTENSHIDISIPQGLAYELIAHCFYAKDGEIDLDETLQVLKRDFHCHEIWLEFIKALALYKKSSSIDLASISPGLLPLCELAFVAELVLKLQTDAQAFSCQDRRRQVSLVTLHQRQRNVKQTINLLKSKLNLSLNRDAWLQAATEISMLGQELGEIQKSIYSVENA